MKKLDAEERALLEAFETSALKSVGHVNAELKKHKEYAVATFQKDSRINIACLRKIYVHCKSAPWSKDCLTRL